MMRDFLKNRNKGFTLVELLVVIAIITTMLGVILFSVSEARQNSREKKRVADLSNIAFAVTIYAEKNRNYPNYSGGIEITPGSAIDVIVKQYNGNSYTDPLATGGYTYHYDSDFTCSEPNQIVVFAETMEKASSGNFNSVCTHSSADRDTAGDNSYIIVIAP
jgi:prepilin-type N-terminal cleavage/methylation domain-containing protein